MSCTNSGSPINIDISSSSGKCDMKCDLRFNYKSSSCIATNNTDYISITYDKNPLAPVTYNSIKYQVSSIKIYSPSLHTFGGEHAGAEMIIEHNSSQGTNPLFICVPLTKNNATTDVSSKLNVIINSVAEHAPAAGNTTTIPMEDFSLNSFVPYKPFFSYTASNFTLPCEQQVDFIVFVPRDNLDINITDKDLNKLNELISAPIFPIKSGTPFFFNPVGPGTGQGDDIFIDCKPINRSEDENLMSMNNGNGNSDSTSSGIDINSIVSSPIFQLLIGSLIFVVILYLVKTGITMLHSKMYEISPTST